MSNLSFSSELYGPAEEIFPPGIREIYARWDYIEMSGQTSLRREWIVNGKLWIEVEEAWDHDTRGSQGTIYDISIYDRIGGLPTGEWVLNVYLNNDSVPALSGQFSIKPLREYETSSPDASRSAWVADWYQLVVDGVTVLEAQYRLGRLSWFPDSQHIAVSETIPAGEFESQGPPGPGYRLWRINLLTGEQVLIGDEDDYLHSPAVSPDGRWMAVIRGNGYGDACFSGSGLAFLPLAEDMTPGEPLSIYDFEGLDPYLTEDVYPIDGESLLRPGEWENSEAFLAALAFTCAPEGSAGIYRIFVNEARAERLRTLEP